MSPPMLLCSLALGLPLLGQAPSQAPKAPIPGYTMGMPAIARSPLSPSDLQQMKEVLLFTEEDVRYLRMSKAVLADQVDAILDVWYGFVGSKPQLLASFSQGGKPDGAYLAAVRKRFGQWILDTAEANFDQAWLDYQQEIGLRHSARKKNQVDHAKASSHVPFRYLHLLTVPVTTTLKPFLAKKGHSPEDVARMHQAWVKAVLLQTTLWSAPYVDSAQF